MPFWSATIPTQPSHGGVACTSSSSTPPVTSKHVATPSKVPNSPTHGAIAATPLWTSSTSP